MLLSSFCQVFKTWLFVFCVFKTWLFVNSYRDSSVVRPMRRCQSDLGYVSQETVNSDISTSLLRPRVGICKKPASDVCTARNNHTPRANRAVDRPSKLRAKVTDAWFPSFRCHFTIPISCCHFRTLLLLTCCCYCVAYQWNLIGISFRSVCARDE